MKKKYFLFFAGFLAALNIFVWQEVFALQKPAELEVDFLAVGQGDSIFIKTPQGHQIIIDGGPNSILLQKLAERMPFWDKTIDLVILTHPEKDHMTGLLDVLQKYQVNYFLWTGVVKDDAENKKLAELLDKAQNLDNNFLAQISGVSQGTRVITTGFVQKIKAGQAEISVLYPFENLSGKELKDTSNDAGVVARLVYGGNSFLFTGDISSTLENKLISQGIELESNVLKVAHHGSKYSTSESFLAAVSPETAVIEVGKNSYGHPTPEVLNRLEKFGINIKRTDKNGDINLKSNGHTISGF